MGSLQEAFLNKADKVKEVTGGDPRESSQALTLKQPSVRRLDNPQVHDLCGCQTLGEFREAAKRLLLRTPNLIDEVILIARELFEKESFFKPFNAALYQLQNNLRMTTDNEEQEKFIKQALRRAGADPWKKKNRKQ